MKNILVVILFFISLIVSGTNYYVKNGGDNLLSGANDANAWATVAKVKATTLYPGDTVFFKRGSTWSEQLLVNNSGNATSDIVFTSYGTGDAPIFSAKKIYTNWTKDGNIYWCTGAYRTYYMLLINGNWGIRVTTSAADCNVNLEFYDKISLPSGGDNDTMFVYLDNGADTSNIIGTTIDDLVKTISKSYITFDSLHIKFAGSTGFSMVTASHDIKIKNCKLDTIAGTAILFTTDSYNGIFSNDSIDFCGNNGIYLQYVDYVDVSYCHITKAGNRSPSTGDRQSIGIWHCSEIYIHNSSIIHSGAGTVLESNSYTGYQTQTNNKYWDNIIILDNPSISYHIFNVGKGTFEIYNNIIIATNAGDGCEFIYASSQDITYSKVYAYHNTVIDAGYALSLYCITAIPNVNTSFVLKNNIFKGIRMRNIEKAHTNSIYLYPYITIDYNIYTDNTGTKFDWLGTAYNFANYQTISSQETNSFIDDPEFVGGSPYSYTLQATSPAIDYGVDVGVILDYTGNLRDASPDLGVYESGAIPPVPELAQVQTFNPINVTIKSAIGIGIIIDEGEAAVTERGLCWSTSANPTTADSKVTSGTGLGYFTGSITGLSTNTTYHVRAYGTNSEGTTYGDDISFTTDKWNYLYHNGEIVTHNGKPVIVR